MHGVLATTMPVGPVLIVNGPIRRAHRHEQRQGNVLGQGNRANLTIGRALQLVVRNVGGGRPGDVDRATHGNPGKLSFCFAEDEEGSPWEPLASARASEAGADTVTLSRARARAASSTSAPDPEELAATLAAGCAACTTRSWCSASTPSSSSAPTTPACSPTPAGPSAC